MSWCNSLSSDSKRKEQESGGTLLVALSTIAALSVIAGTLTVSLTSRTHTAARAASWHEALVSAESAADLALAEVRRVLPADPDVYSLGSSVSDAWNGWTNATNPLPTGKQLPSGVLRLITQPLVHAGEGNTATAAVVTVEAPSDLYFPNKNYRWLRLRSVGTASLLGRRQAPLNPFDTELRHYAFQRQRADIIGRPNRPVSSPEVSRSVEVIVRPVLAFEQALLSAGSFSSSSSSSVVDSFDSSDSSKSTLGLYDSNKQQRNGSVFTLGTSFPSVGRVFGSVGTNGGDLDSNPLISGAINNEFYQVVNPVGAPSWATSAPLLPGNGNSTSNISADLSASSPTRYRMGTLNGKINISGLWPLSTYMELYLSGDLKGEIKMDPGVNLKVFVGGNLKVDTSDLSNRSYRAANLQIYGIQPPVGQARKIDVDLGTDLYASIYAPGHNLTITGSGHWFGSIVAKGVDIPGTLKLHYDESLARGVGPVIDYKVASWIEDVR